ncbi:MAG: acylphosphatase [Candidatus Nealsonbacteria bacterium]|nr:acylphosphatase [Candidatus Nealsonbacteria bacterium]
MAEESTVEQREVYFSGRVQGVGFRYTVRMIAGQFAVAGFVRNLPDGRVQLVAEGTADELGRFLDAINTEMGRNIKDTRQRTTSAAGDFAGFDIRF